MNTPNQPESSEIVSVDGTIDAIAREAVTEARRMAVRSPVDSLTTRPDYTPTPDRRYYVLKGRLWRLSNPGLNQKTHQQLVAQLIAAKREVREGKDSIHRIAARLNADKAKRALGERGEVWWTDGAPDYHRCLVINTPYASWFMGSERVSSPFYRRYSLPATIIAATTAWDDVLRYSHEESGCVRSDYQ